MIVFFWRTVGPRFTILLLDVELKNIDRSKCRVCPNWGGGQFFP